MSALPRPLRIDRGAPEVDRWGLAELMALASGADAAACRALLKADPWLVRLESAGPEAGRPARRARLADPLARRRR